MPDPVDPTRIAPTSQDQLLSLTGERDATAAAHSARVPQPTAFGPSVAPGEVGTLGPYRVVKQLGAGGMGAVYLTVDTRLDRKLALKVMLPAFAADTSAKERFLREAKAAAKISHDNVVTVFEADERDGVPYIAMQFLQGYPLDEYLKKKGPPPLAHVLRIARESALGLSAAHALGLVHRDIKPANLWLEAPNGRVKVLDFGLARAVDAEAELTKSGAVMGTPAYMSPEQARGQQVDHRTDLFSLGGVMYCLCTGRTPFTGPNVMAVLMALGTEDPTPVRELNPNVPEPLAQLIHQLLAKKPEQRPQTATEVAKRLRAILERPVAGGSGSAAVPMASAADLSTSQPVVVHPVPVQPPNVVPMQITAQPESAFADLDADGVTTTESELAAPKPERKKSGGKGVLIAAGVAVLLAGVAVTVVAMQLGKKPTPVVAEDAPPTAPPGGKADKPKPKAGPDQPKPSAPDPVPARRPPKPWVPPAVVPVGESPFDKLDPAAIPKEDRFGWQPKELVAVAGTHSPRTWLSCDQFPRLAVSSDGSLVAASGNASYPLQVWDAKTRAVKAELSLPPSYHAYAPVFTSDGKSVVTRIHHPGRWYYRWDLAEPNREPVEWVKGLPIDDMATGMWLSPGSKRLVIRSAQVTVWDVTAEPPRELARFAAHPAWDVGVSRDCTRIAAYREATKNVIVSDVGADGAKERFVIDANAAMLALSPDGTKLVTWQGDALRYWDLTAEKPVPADFAPRTPHAHAALAFSPDGTRLVSQDADRALRLWDMTGPVPKLSWKAPLALRGFDPARLTRVAFAGEKGDTLVALTSWGFVHFIDISGAEPKILDQIEPSEPVGPELTIDGASGRVSLGRAEDGRFQFWDLARANPVPTDRVAPRGLVAHTSGGEKMAVWDGGLRLVAGGKPVGSLPGMESIGTFTANGQSYWGMMSYGTRGLEVGGWDLSGAAPRQVVTALLPPGGHPVWPFRLVRNDTVLASITGGTLMFYDLTAAEPKLLSTFPPGAGPSACVFPDGEHVLKADHTTPQLWQLSDRGWAKVWESPVFGGPFATHPSGKLFALYSQGEITVRRTQDGGVVRTIPFSKALPQKLEFAPDGRHLFVVNGFNTVYVLRLNDLIPRAGGATDRDAAK